MRYITIFSTVFAIFGVILVSGSSFMIPYTVGEQVRVEKSKTWEDDTFALMPFKNRTCLLDSIVQNTSIIQIDVESSDFIVLKIISDATDKVWFERETRWDVTSYWTSPSLGYGNWRFVFYNPSSTPVNVTAKVTEFFLKATEYREATHYRPMLDPFYGYSGMVALIIAIGLNIMYISHVAKRQE